MKILFGCLAGSRLYGVDTPASDFDYKYVYACDSLEEYLAGHTKVKNTVGETVAGVKVESEYFHIQDYARLIGQAQTIAMDMLFAPAWAWLDCSPEWMELLLNQRKVVSKDLGPFIGYARSQSVKYSLKGEKLLTLEKVLEWLEDKKGIPTREVFEEAQGLFNGMAGIRLWVDLKTPYIGEPIRLIEVCGRSFGETTPFKLWRDPLESLMKTYGGRAREAKESGGRDLKAMYHATRIICQATELLKDGRITFPRPEVDLLMDIRTGRYNADEVADIISHHNSLFEQALETSTLQDKTDRDWLKDWAIRCQISNFPK